MSERYEDYMDDKVIQLEAMIGTLRAQLLVAESRAHKATLRAEHAEALLAQYKEISNKLTVVR